VTETGVMPCIVSASRRLAFRTGVAGRVNTMNLPYIYTTQPIS